MIPFGRVYANSGISKTHQVQYLPNIIDGCLEMLRLKMRDVSRIYLDLVCGRHRLKYPNGRPVPVGEAWTDGAGAWTTTSFRRTGKGSPRAADGRLVEQGVPLQIRWPGSEALNFDPQLAGIDWEVHKSLLGPSPFADEEDSKLLGNRLLGVYRCPHKLGDDDRKHWVGANDTDLLLEWFEKALDEGLTEVPLPLLKPVAVRPW